MGMIWAMPGMDSRRGRNSQSAMPRKAMGDVAPVSERRPISMISPMIEVTGPITGVIPVGNWPLVTLRRSETNCRLFRLSVPQSNSTKTMDSPTPELERTRTTPAAPLTAVSMGRVTRDSTSSGARPWASVMMVTVGRLRSGSTSTGKAESTQIPHPRIKVAKAKTGRRWRSEKPMMRSNMVISPPAFARHPEPPPDLRARPSPWPIRPTARPAFRF